jgi:hypothetical protein
VLTLVCPNSLSEPSAFRWEVSSQDPAVRVDPRRPPPPLKYLRMWDPLICPLGPVLGDQEG